MTWTPTSASDPVLLIIETCGRQLVARAPWVDSAPAPGEISLVLDIHDFLTVKDPLSLLIGPQGAALAPLTPFEPIETLKVKISSWAVAPESLAKSYTSAVEEIHKQNLARRAGIQLAGSISTEDLQAADNVRRMKVT